jgi:hypothetical protein
LVKYLAFAIAPHPKHDSGWLKLVAGFPAEPANMIVCPRPKVATQDAFIVIVDEL